MKLLIVTLVLGTLVVLSQKVFSAQTEANRAAYRQQNNLTAGIRIEGSLSCDGIKNAMANACILKIKDAKTGRIFQLVGSSSAMNLFQAGIRNIGVEGILADAQTIQVNLAETL